MLRKLVLEVSKGLICFVRSAKLSLELTEENTPNEFADLATGITRKNEEVLTGLFESRVVRSRKGERG